MAAQIVPIVALFVVMMALIFVALRAKTTHFECPVCGCTFKVSISAFMVAFHVLGKREVTCPNCGYRGLLPPINDDEQ
ncbi:hypothetical protein [Sporolactobacillus putidus]|uniref:Uncharacterized protein n=1 Tax=Sporolactobacillus putidus TaxID=492735 RepID=A0A917S7C7_9BACL|nr:hypothetical protein [Sporolactobacillus putidus]GGL59357.1 hypothetical protein GCM10007968_24190 [Sporolactobacillus putidus]